MAALRDRSLFLMLWKLMVGLRYARKMESFARVLQSTSRVKRCVYINLISMEMREKYQNPPQETSES